jgi:hypothetical protein
MFEHGYIVYPTPQVGEDRDWSRTPVAYPYLASRADLPVVQADQEWQDTDVDVEVGDRITIVQVGGEWRAWEGIPYHDGNGTTYFACDWEAPEPNASVGALIGRIDTDRDNIFLVGRCGVHVSEANGKLQLRMNDKQVEDNAGSLTVHIIVLSPEE